MKEVVATGIGLAAQIKGIEVAGETGTAQASKGGDRRLVYRLRLPAGNADGRLRRGGGAWRLRRRRRRPDRARFNGPGPRRKSERHSPATRSPVINRHCPLTPNPLPTGGEGEIDPLSQRGRGRGRRGLGVRGAALLLLCLLFGSFLQSAPGSAAVISLNDVQENWGEPSNNIEVELYRRSMARRTFT